jgi:hypothetical protein
VVVAGGHVVLRTAREVGETVEEVVVEEGEKETGKAVVTAVVVGAAVATVTRRRIQGTGNIIITATTRTAPTIIRTADTTAIKTAARTNARAR